MKGNDRYAEVLREGKWLECTMKDLKAGDIFRVFEPDGTPLEANGKTEFVADCDAFPNNTIPGTWAIEAH